MPSFNYISNANAANNCGAIPHFIDCENQLWVSAQRNLMIFKKKFEINRKKFSQ